MKELESNKNDRITSGIRSIVGIVPFVGPLLQEIVTTTIPNQKIDRVIEFIKLLDSKITEIEKEQLNIKKDNQEFNLFFEDLLSEASRTISDERREYLYNILKNSLAENHIDYIQSRHLIKIASQLNDIQIILLSSYKMRTKNSVEKFWNTHPEIMKNSILTANSTLEEQTNYALHNNYKENLASLGLLTRIYKSPEFPPKRNQNTTKLVIRNYEITKMGKLLLDKIGL